MQSSRWRGRTARVAAGSAAGAIALAGAVTTAGAGSASAAAGQPLVAFSFSAPSGGTGAKQTQFPSDGTASVTTSVVSANGGQVTSVDSRAGAGSAVKLPAFDPSAGGPRAVISVVNAAGSDQMAPGSRSFSWGADFVLSADSATHASGSEDDGDNLVQRGLYGHTQMKLDADGRRPGCRLRGSTGSAGAVRVVAPMTVDAGHWYRATCSRSGSTLSITVSQFDSSGAVARTWSRSATSGAGFGSITWDRVRTPLTIGGKLTSRGHLTSGSSDQFNGRVDNVELRITG